MSVNKIGKADVKVKRHAVLALALILIASLLMPQTALAAGLGNIGMGGGVPDEVESSSKTAKETTPAIKTAQTTQTTQTTSFHTQVAPNTFYLQVNIPNDDKSFIIPVGNLSGAAYDWTIDWGDETPIGSAIGNATNDENAILTELTHTYANPGAYEIIITPGGTPTDTPQDDTMSGWLQAFGFSLDDSLKFNDAINKKKVIGVDGILDDAAINITMNAACGYMFVGCINLTMGEKFTFESEKTEVGSGFCQNMFANITGNDFTMNDVFNLPQEIETTGMYFCEGMFARCRGANFTMNDVFNLPQKIDIADNSFCSSMFGYCSGRSFTMNSVFNLPQKIKTSGSGFFESMFSGCSGDNFTMNDVFNLPQKTETIGDRFCADMFADCGGRSFLVNDEFKFPKLRDDNDMTKNGVFQQVFFNISRIQWRSAESIIGDCAAPDYAGGSDGGDTGSDSGGGEGFDSGAGVGTFPPAFPLYGSIDPKWRETDDELEYTVTGIVYDKAGTPLKGAAVNVYQGSDAIGTTATSDTDGRYVITGVPQWTSGDEYIVKAKSGTDIAENLNTFKIAPTALLTAKGVSNPKASDKEFFDIRFGRIFTVTFVDWIGNIIGTPQKVEKGKDAIAPQAPARSGHTFTGWDTDFQDVRSNLTVKALYRKDDAGGENPGGKPGDNGTGTPGGNAQLAPAKAVKSLNAAVKTIYVQKGKTVKIPYVAYANAGYKNKKALISWTASKGKIVSVDGKKDALKKGTVKSGKLDAKSVIKIKAKKKGAVKVTLSVNGRKLLLNIKVVKNKKAVKSFKLSKVKKLKVGKSKVIKISKITKKATSGTATFTIAKKYAKYLTVDAAGKLTAKKVYKKGKKTVPVKIKVGTKVKTIRVKVAKK